MANISFVPLHANPCTDSFISSATECFTQQATYGTCQSLSAFSKVLIGAAVVIFVLDMIMLWRFRNKLKKRLAGLLLNIQLQN